MARKTGAVTIRDVSQLAGVSPATVSKALNNSPEINELTRERVREAARKLDFRPNSIARSLRVKRTRTLGLITDDIEGVFTTSLMRGVEEAASGEGFSVFLCNSYGRLEREREHLEVLLDKQVDGVILLSGFRVRERGAPALPLGGMPVLYLYQYSEAIAAPAILPDDRGGGALGARHLLAGGRRRVAFINGPAKYEATHERLEGYRLALAEAGLPFDPALVRVAATWHEHSGYEQAHGLMALPEPPDAIFCASDNLAFGALDALHERGVRVPDEVALVGYDNRPSAAYQRPPLTTVALPLYEMGRLAGELVMAAVRGEPVEPGVRYVACSLVQRASCGVPLSDQGHAGPAGRASSEL